MNKYSDALANLEELTSEQLTSFTEQLLDLLTPDNREQLLNLESLSPNLFEIQTSEVFNNSPDLVKLEELTNRKLTNFAEQLLKLLNPFNRQELLNSDSLDSNNNSISSSSSFKKKAEISVSKIKNNLGGTKENSLENQRKCQKEHRKRTNWDPKARELYLKKKRESYRRGRDKINLDFEHKELFLEKERKSRKKYRAKVNSDPVARKLYLEKRRERDKKTEIRQKKIP